MCSSAALFADNQIVAATHEERFTRRKNDEDFPFQSIAYCLSEAGLKPADLDSVAINTISQNWYDPLLRKYSGWSVDDYIREQYSVYYPRLYQQKDVSHWQVFQDKVDWRMAENMRIFRNVLNEKECDRQNTYDRIRPAEIGELVGVGPEKVKVVEHHRAHAYYAYYASPFRGRPVLAATIDGFGDGLNATLGIFDNNGNYTRTYSTSDCNIGRIYRYVTLLLGMKPNEHEYKVMGLAPYGKEKYAHKALEALSCTLQTNGIGFQWKNRPPDSYFWFQKKFEGVRFDNIAWALQAWTEELLRQWIENAINEYGITDVVISGGVAMNIKAMGEIAKLPKLTNMFIAGSGGDESLAIGGAYCLAQDNSPEQKWDAKLISDLSSLYLGPEADIQAEKQAIDSLNQNEFEIHTGHTPEVIANLLVKGLILGRAVGRMEFGQRALGNRSILADPIVPHVKDRINRVVKNRDFWMPFAPVIMDNYADKYLINPKKIDSPHMTLGFPTTSEGSRCMLAACHPADKSARPQILSRKINPGLYEILEAFERLTGRGALLNTSFNLHGHPIVNTPADAVHVLTGSELDGLILNNYLILT